MADVVVIGGGHNGLVAAAYLAMTGLKVTVLERRAQVGGAAVTEEFHPGFRNSIAAYTVSLLNPTIIRDLELARHGLRIVERPLSNFLPLPDGRYLKVAPGRTKAEVAKFSVRDAEGLGAYEARLERVTNVLRALALDPPPNLATGLGLLANLNAFVNAARVGNRLRSLDLEGQRDLLELFTRSAGDFLDQWFESDPIKAILGFDGIVGTYASPYAAGTGYVLLHHCWGEVNGKKGVWGHAIGGMGAIAQAIARACAVRNVDIRTNCAVNEILIEKDRAIGVVTEKGEKLTARAIVSNLHPKLTFEKLVDPTALPADFRARIGSYRSGSGSFRMNLALSELPSFSALPGREAAEHHGAGIVIAPSLAYMERAFFDARLNGWSAEPIVEMLIPSTLDDSLALPGRHVASLFCQHVAPKLPDGRSWDETRNARDGRRSYDRYGRGLCARLQGLGHRPPDPLAARPRARVRPYRWRHFSWAPEPRPALFGKAGARSRRLPFAHSGLIHVRRLDPSRRRRHRRPRPQRRPRDDPRFPRSPMGSRLGLLSTLIPKQMRMEPAALA
jgi:phytoene dehydrogenase-like protein